MMNKDRQLLSQALVNEVWEIVERLEHTHRDWIFLHSRKSDADLIEDNQVELDSVRNELRQRITELCSEPSNEVYRQLAIERQKLPAIEQAHIEANANTMNAMIRELDKMRDKYEAEIARLASV